MRLKVSCQMKVWRWAMISVDQKMTNFPFAPRARMCTLHAPVFVVLILNVSVCLRVHRGQREALHISSLWRWTQKIHCLVYFTPSLFSFCQWNACCEE